MFDIEVGWKNRLSGGVLPPASAKDGWLVRHTAEPAFVEPTLRVLQGDPLSARAIVVAAPGAVGKSTYARTLAAKTHSVVIDLARTEPLGGNFFVGGIANAFGYQALTDAYEGRLALIVDALDEAQLRSGAEGFSAGLFDLGKIVEHTESLPAALFGRASAAEVAWLILKDAGIEPCLLEIDFFDEALALEYISRKMPLVARRRPATKSAYERHGAVFRDLGVATRTKLVQTPGGDDIRFAGYAPVLDAICAFALEEESLNPQARVAQISAQSPVALIVEIAGSILSREKEKLIKQLKLEYGELNESYLPILYSEEEQLKRVLCEIVGAPVPLMPAISLTPLREAYERMVIEFAPQHPFLDGRGGASNAAFAAYVSVWSIMTGYGGKETRKALMNKPDFGSGLFFELYMYWLRDSYDGEGGGKVKSVDLTDVGALYASFAMQATHGQQPTLEVNGEDGDSVVEVEFEMVVLDDGEDMQHSGRSYGPFESDVGSFLEIRGPLAGVRVIAPIAIVVGDGNTVNVTAPVEIDVDMLEIDGRELRIFQSVSRDRVDTRQVSISAADASVDRVDRVVVYGGKLSVSFLGDQLHPWTEYAVIPPLAPNEDIAVLRRRLRKILTAFRSHSKGGLVRLAAKIDHARMMKRDNLGPRLVKKLRDDGILTTFSAGKFYVLNQDKMASTLNMDYSAIQNHRWTPESDEYLALCLG